MNPNVCRLGCGYTHPVATMVRDHETWKCALRDGA